VIKELLPDRAPGLDEFIGAFYQRAWPFIKRHIIAGLLKLGAGDGTGFPRARMPRTLVAIGQSVWTP
jgi:hypothetical protein